MKIEKVNEHQIRCTLTREDLADRELKISELAYGTDKAKSLFRDMMRQAAYECGFEAEDIPLMIEAIPLNSECIVLIITKVEDPEELDTRFSKFAPSIHEEEYPDEEIEDITDSFTDSAEDVLNMLRKINNNDFTDDTSSRDIVPAQPAKPSLTAENASAKMTNWIFSFSSLHEVTRLAHVIGASYRGENSLYKDEASGSYLLLISSKEIALPDFNRICNIILEFGRAEKTVLATKSYLEEHYEPLIKDNALEALSSI